VNEVEGDVDAVKGGSERSGIEEVGLDEFRPETAGAETIRESN